MTKKSPYVKESAEAVLSETESRQAQHELELAKKALSQAINDAVRWRRLAVEGWADAAHETHEKARATELQLHRTQNELGAARQKLEEMRVLQGRLRKAQANRVKERQRLKLARRRSQQRTEKVRLRLREELDTARRREDEQRERADQLNAELEGLRASISWRVTRPLRAVRRGQFRLQGKL